MKHWNRTRCRPYSFVPAKKYKTGSDDVVSVESQNAESLKGLIDERPQYEVDGSGLLDPGHVHEIKNEDFVNLIHKVNNAIYMKESFHDEKVI